MILTYFRSLTANKRWVLKLINALDEELDDAQRASQEFLGRVDARLTADRFIESGNAVAEGDAHHSVRAKVTPSSLTEPGVGYVRHGRSVGDGCSGAGSGSRTVAAYHSGMADIFERYGVEIPEDMPITRMLRDFMAGKGGFEGYEPQRPLEETVALLGGAVIALEERLANLQRQNRK